MLEEALAQRREKLYPIGGCRTSIEREKKLRRSETPFIRREAFWHSANKSKGTVKKFGRPQKIQKSREGTLAQRSQGGRSLAPAAAREFVWASPVSYTHLL